MISRSGQLFIGTSGWSYDHWEGPFYPQGLAPGQRLAYYAERFRSVEINSVFYRLPSEHTLHRWHDTVPPHFRFAVKASRYITHMKKLTDPEPSLGPMIACIDGLGERLGPLLFQLPPRWRLNIGRLDAFLKTLGDGHRCAFEFRDHSWLTPQVFDLLARHRAALCVYDLDGFTSPIEITADFVYVRLHGPAGPYRGSYDDAALTGWAKALSDWLAEGLDVYCYFDNDEAGHAAHDAARLSRRLRG